MTNKNIVPSNKTRPSKNTKRPGNRIRRVAAQTGADLKQVADGAIARDEKCQEFIDLISEFNPKALLADGFEPALIGMAERCGQPALAVYDQKKCIQVLVDGGMTEEEAREYFEFNVIGAWMGENSPIFMWPHPDHVSLSESEYGYLQGLAHTGNDILEADAKRGLTLREMQEQLPWTIPYSREFKASQAVEGHRNLVHDLMHVQKSLGRIAALAEDIDHGRPKTRLTREQLSKEVADLVICALHIAKTNPLGAFDLQDAVVQNSELRNDALGAMSVKKASK